VARAVGIGAVKYADLSNDRTKDYVFDYQRMLAFEGNTAPYLQYAHARIRAIFRRAGIAPAPHPDGVQVAEAAERTLALTLLETGRVLNEVAASLQFHRLAVHLYAVSTAFSDFYERCPVLRASGETRRSRLALCDVTARVLELGLGLLGIEAPERM
jgi:arginyl-tRNA synthetase